LRAGERARPRARERQRKISEARSCIGLVGQAARRMVFTASCVYRTRSVTNGVYTMVMLGFLFCCACLVERQPFLDLAWGMVGRYGRAGSRLHMHAPIPTQGWIRWSRRLFQTITVRFCRLNESDASENLVRFARLLTCSRKELNT
jgi:hypothetical protein